jgi:FkbM family methyltransferase
VDARFQRRRACGLDVDGLAHPLLIFVRRSHDREKFGTLQRNLSPLKDAIDFQLTKVPALYLLVERFREWVNWDKRVYLSFVRSGDTVLDVGANVGAHSVFLSHLVGKRGRVLAFEPLPANINSLEETMGRRGRFNNITIFPVAIGNPQAVGGTVTIKIPGDDLTQASLQLQTTGSWEGKTDIREISVQLVSLDADKDVQSLQNLELVKIDVEGGELDVLRGASYTLSRHLPLIYCEAYDNWEASFGYTPADLLNFARSLGYSAARVFSRGRVHPVRLDQAVPADFFSVSADVLLFADRHRAAVERFDRRYHVHISSR